MVIYNIPASVVENYAHNDLIIRSDDPIELVKAFRKADSGSVRYLQLLKPDCIPDPLLEIVEPVRLELVVEDFTQDVDFFHNYSEVGLKHPVRVRIRTSPGFGEAVKLPLSLGFAVALETTQPAPALVEELKAVLEYYLHNTDVRQPVDFFHSLLTVLFDGTDCTLWEIQGEDPALHGFVTEAGQLVLSQRLPSLALDQSPSTFLHDLKLELLTDHGECMTCPFFTKCMGYFKFPDRRFSCSHIRELLEILWNAAKELRREYEAAMRDQHPKRGQAEEEPR
ncbi:MAG: hypothetical protein V1792_14680 [Pseudomonadota bacterium]